MERDSEERTRALLIQHAVVVERSLDEIQLGCCGGQSGWIDPLANAAGREGEAILMKIGPSWAAGLLAREVRVRLGPPRRRIASVVVPIEWEAAGLSSLFPVLSGDLEIVPLGPGRCRIVLSGSYIVPLGEIGRGLDRALLHRVAASTVRSFLRQLSAHLEADRTPAALPAADRPVAQRHVLAARESGG
jgi:hypothetical protein